MEVYLQVGLYIIATILPWSINPTKRVILGFCEV